MNKNLDPIWEDNSPDLLRMLLALTRDPDLAEDCLQDTYLRAKAGFSTYRGGSVKAWLQTIARNVFYSHVRRKGFGPHQSLETAAELVDGSLQIGSEAYIDLLAVREAVSSLEPDLRRAFLMKYYGGCDYDEVAEYLSCTPEAAKHRVWRAMQRLRKAVGAEAETVLGCSDLWGAKLLDWFYKALPEKESQDVSSHVALCPSCRAGLNEMRRLVTTLDNAEEDYRILTLIDLNETGDTTRYVWVRRVNERSEPIRKFVWHRRDGWTIDYLALQGEPVEIRHCDAPDKTGMSRFEGLLPEPVAPGGVTDAMFIACPREGDEWRANQQANGVWHYHHKHTPFPHKEGLFMVTIRLPKGARLLRADPEPRKISARTGRVSMAWQVITDPALHSSRGPKFQFEADVDYALKGVARQPYDP